MPSTPRPTRIGMIVPSSNTCLEPMSYRILGDRSDVTIHFSRIPVTRIELDESADQQFAGDGMRQAAELLATADVDVIAWNGTAGSWLGVQADRSLAAQITSATGVPATTSTLAYLDAFALFGIHRIGLVTPYIAAVNDQIIRTYADQKIEVIAQRHFDRTDNESFARVPQSDIQDGGHDMATTNPDAVVFLCTNLPGAPIVQTLEANTGVPMLDSVAVTLWHCLRQVPGTNLLDPRWGRLLSREPR